MRESRFLDKITEVIVPELPSTQPPARAAPVGS